MKKLINIKILERIKQAYAKGKHSKVVGFTGRTHSEETRQKMREAKLKNPTKYWLGKPRDESTRKKISKNLTGRFVGENHPNFGKPVSEETKKKLCMYTGEKSSNWRGGLSFLPYSPDFTPVLKKEIQERDNKKCKLCGKTEWRMATHHIDYDKTNNDTKNLVTLCYKCHGDTNFDRVYWEGYFKQSLITHRRIPLLREVRV
jgi:hypothetical protein